MSITTLTGAQIAAKVKDKTLTAREVTDAFLAQIEENDSNIKAFLTVTADNARAQADAIDVRIANGEAVGALAGVPVALKDNLCTRGVETTCGSKILKGFVPPYNATVIEKLISAGAISLGKVNMDEFAMGSSCENSAYFPTRNPWNIRAVPGGSSGGSAAAVAADFAPMALGSDTGGSIRQPAAYCGIVGLKPTYGCISRYGLVAYASSLDQIGPMTRTVEDAALMLNVLAGQDAYDATSVPRAVPNYLDALQGGSNLVGVKIGIPIEYFAEGITTEVKASVLAAIGILRGLGATVIEGISLPTTEYALAAYYVVAPAEASSNLARYDGVRYGPRTSKIVSGHIDLFEKTREEGFGPEVKQRILTGTYALSAGYYDAFYLKGMQVRTLLRQEFDKAFTQCDALATPTAPTVAFGIGEKTDDPLAMKLSDICTIPANMAGIPALSLPCGFDANGMPIGLQLMGPAFSEEMLLKIGHAYQCVTDWHTRRP
jgi:aspartyl-tRNA(Asn)/glutamyl-tRNA(Gln) amidotransferase subunit A